MRMEDAEHSAALADLTEATAEPTLVTTRFGAPLAANDAFRAFADLFDWRQARPPRPEEIAGGAVAEAAFRACRDALVTGVGEHAARTAKGAVSLRARLSKDGDRLYWRFALAAGEAEAADADDAAPFAHAAVGVALVDGRDGDPGLGPCNAAFLSLFPTAQPGRRWESLVEASDAPRLLGLLAAGDMGGDLQVSPAGRPDVTVTLSLARPDPKGPRHLFAHETARVAPGEQESDQGLKLQALGQLAGGVAHDFNNVLQAILGFCDLLLARHPVADPSHADLSQIKQNAVRASALVRQLLAFSRAQDLNPRPQHLADVLVDIADLLRRLIGAKVDLRLTHGADVPPAKFDETQLEMAIMNLAVNARDAMPHGGLLEIVTGRRSVGPGERAEGGRLPPGEYALIRVTDNGEGMDEDVRARVFEPFFTTKGVGKGTGLGLSTVYGIVKQSGGHIFLDSKKGEGTTFRLYFPAARIEAKPVPAPEAPARPVDLTGRGRILLVEDEEAVRAFTARALMSRGYEVVAAEDGAEALDLLRAGLTVDLVVSDVMMPAMDGPTFVVEAGDLLKDSRILFVSGYGADAVRRELVDDPRISFLAKPFSLKDLASAVKQALTA